MIDHRKIRNESYPFHLIKDLEGNPTPNLLSQSIEDEVRDMARTPVSYQKGLTARRLTVREAYQEVCADLFSGDSGIEFGCGAFGFMKNHIIPSHMDWMQYDINPTAVALNQKHSKRPFRPAPDVRVGNFYEMPLEENSVNLIAGFCAFDSIYHHGEAIEEVARALRPGGTFVHIIDALPEAIPLALTEQRNRLQHGLDSEVTCGFYTHRSENRPGFITTTKLATHIDSIEYGYVRMGEYAHNLMQEHLKDHGLDVIENDERTCETYEARRHVNKWLKRFNAKLPPDHNRYEHDHGYFEANHEPTVDKGMVSQYLALDVLVARKR